MDWPMADEWPLAPQDTCCCSCEEHKKRPAPKPPDPGGPAQAQLYPDQSILSQSLPYPIYSQSTMELPPPPDNVSTLRGETPRDLRNKAEKQRRDKMNKAINELSKIVPPVLAMNRKVDKTSVLRLTAHYLRSHQHVFGDSLDSANQFGVSSVEALISFLNGFIITTTYKGLVVVISPNVEQYLGYTELELIGHNIINIIHEEDQQMMLEQLIPRSYLLGPHDEILFPEDPESKEKVAEALRNEKRSFNIRFKKNGQRNEKHIYINCHIEGSFRKSDRACRSNNRRSQMVRRLRARGRHWCSSGNDVVFIGVVRPSYETFVTESKLDSSLMEYRTRHSIDGEIISCDSRISVATGYMASEVQGANAMNFMHRDDVRWVVVALREMYDHHRLSGESCYRLMTKCGSFVYMRTKGFLEVDKNTGAVTSFVCINRVVDKEEGKQLNMEMKKKFMMLVNNTDETPPEDDDDEEVNDRQGLPVEDPQQLQKVILHLVTNLPSPSTDITQLNSPFQEERSPYRLSIIPPKKERIVNAIDKIYNVIQCFKYIPSSLRYKKENIPKSLQSKESPSETMASNPEKPEKSKKSEKSNSGTDPPTSNNSQPKSDYDTVSQNIDPFSFYPDVFPGTSTEISPQAGPSGLQRPIDPLILRRLYISEPEYIAENHTQVSSTIKDSIKTYAVMIPAIVSGKFDESHSSSFDANRYVQPLCPTPDVDVNQPETTDVSNPVQYRSYPEPSSSTMRQLKNSAPEHRGSSDRTQASGSFHSLQVPKSNNNYPRGSSYYSPHSVVTYPNIIPINQPPWNRGTHGSWYISENLPAQGIQAVQAGPSRPPPIPNYPITPYPFNPSWQQCYPTYIPEYSNIYQQFEPQAEVKRHYYATKSDEVPSKRQNVGTIAATEYFQQENTQQPMTTTQEDLLSFLEDFTLPKSHVEEGGGILDDFVNSNLSLNMQPHDRAWEEQELGLCLALLEENSIDVPIDPDFELPDVDIVNQISSPMPLASYASFQEPSDVQAGLRFQSEAEAPHLGDDYINIDDVEETIQYLARKVEIIKAVETLQK
ncbi:hypoxia-inducible factor 1-alpha [Papilio machaon]|uniref:hypoxia-inducible factor 1-alpha n=1 Tax=Papilio machaon TaxID=76193 RepID=UPI001E665DF7|nr:hypoxia-inducible factor 1-alpha [Papilio machaon]